MPAETGEEAKVLEVNLKSEQTRPPARYTEATLLSAMETAGKRVDDEELREAMSERGWAPSHPRGHYRGTDHAQVCVPA